VTIYEAIREVREGREAWATHEGRRVRLAPVPTDGFENGRVLARWRCPGGVALCDLDTKDTSNGARVRLSRGRTHRRAGWREVLAMVVEERPRVD